MFRFVVLISSFCFILEAQSSVDVTNSTVYQHPKLEMKVYSAMVDLPLAASWQVVDEDIPSGSAVCLTCHAK